MSSPSKRRRKDNLRGSNKNKPLGIGRSDDEFSYLKSVRDNLNDLVRPVASSSSSTAASSSSQFITPSTEIEDCLQCIEVQQEVIERLEAQVSTLKGFQSEADERYRLSLSRDNERLELSERYLQLSAEFDSLQRARVEEEAKLATERSALLRDQRQMAAQIKQMKIELEQQKKRASGGQQERMRTRNSSKNSSGGAATTTSGETQQALLDSLNSRIHSLESECESERRAAQALRRAGETERRMLETRAEAAEEKAHLATLEAQRHRERAEDNHSVQLALSSAQREIERLQAEKQLADNIVSESAGSAQLLSSLRAELSQVREEAVDRQRRLDELIAERRRTEAAEVIQERLNVAERRLKRASQQLDDAARDAAEAEALRGRHERLLKALEERGIDGGETGVARLPSTLSELRKENDLLRAQLAEHAAASRAASSKASAAEQRVAELAAELAAETEVRRLAERRTSQRERQCVVLARDRQGLQRLLKSYQQFEAEGAAEKNEEKTAEDEKDAEIVKLKELVNELTSQIEQRDSIYLEKEEQKEGKKEAETSTSSSSAAEVKQFEATIRRLNEENERLSTEVARLTYRVGRGDYDPRHTRVLHLIANPLSKATAAAAASKKSAESMEQQQQQQQQQQSSSSQNQFSTPAPLTRTRSAAAWPETPNLASGTPAIGSSTSRSAAFGTPAIGRAFRGNELAEMRELRVAVADGEKRVQRLKQVFKEKIHEFREAVYHLFGFKIDVLDSHYRLLSMYAESSDDFLEFQLCRQGSALGFELLETPVSKRLVREIDTFLNRCNSIPAFLSNLQLDLFNNQTVFN